MSEQSAEIGRAFRQHFEEGGYCDGACEIEGHAWVRDLLEALEHAERALKAAVEQARELLTDIEWRSGRCPACGRHQKEGHNIVCRLAALTSAAGG